MLTKILKSFGCTGKVSDTKQLKLYRHAYSVRIQFYGHRRLSVRPSMAMGNAMSVHQTREAP